MSSNGTIYHIRSLVGFASVSTTAAIAIPVSPVCHQIYEFTPECDIALPMCNPYAPINIKIVSLFKKIKSISVVSESEVYGAFFNRKMFNIE